MSVNVDEDRRPRAPEGEHFIVDGPADSRKIGFGKSLAGVSDPEAVPTTSGEGL